MNGEPQEPKLSPREQKLARIRAQLEQNAMFLAAAANNERMKQKLAEEREKLERELAELEQGEQPRDE